MSAGSVLALQRVVQRRRVELHDRPLRGGRDLPLRELRDQAARGGAGGRGAREPRGRAGPRASPARARTSSAAARVAEGAAAQTRPAGRARAAPRAQQAKPERHPRRATPPAPATSDACWPSTRRRRRGRRGRSPRRRRGAGRPAHRRAGAGQRARPGARRDWARPAAGAHRHVGRRPGPRGQQPGERRHERDAGRRDLADAQRLDLLEQRGRARGDREADRDDDRRRARGSRREVGTIPTNLGSFDETVLAAGPWTTVVAAARSRPRFPTLAQCSASGPDLPRHRATPSDAAMHAANRRHEDHHADGSPRRVQRDDPAVGHQAHRGQGGRDEVRGRHRGRGRSRPVGGHGRHAGPDRRRLHGPLRRGRRRLPRLGRRRPDRRADEPARLRRLLHLVAKYTNPS